MKKILLILGLMGSSCYAVNPIITYVRISTGATQGGGPNVQTATVANSLNLPFVGNGVQCLRSVNGAIAGTGLDCGQGGVSGGSNTIVASPQYQVPFYSVAGTSNVISGASGFNWYGSSVSVPSLVATAQTLSPQYFVGSSTTSGVMESINGGIGLASNLDIYLEPPVGLSAVITQGSKLAFITPNGAGRTYISPQNLSGGIGALTFNLPTSSGTTGQFLSTDGNGTMSWQTVTSSGGSGGSSIYPATATPTFPFGANATSITTPQVTTAGTFIQTFGGGLGSSSLVFKSASTAFDAYDQITDAGPLQLRSTNGSISSRFGEGAQFQGVGSSGWTIENFSNASNPTGLSIENDNNDTTARFINFKSIEGLDALGGNIYYTPSSSLFQSDRSWAFSFGVSASTFNATAFNASQTSFTVTGSGGFGIISSSAGQFGFNEGPSSTFNTFGSNLDAMYANSSSHTLVMNNNSRGEYVVAGTSTTDVVGNTPVWCGLGALCDSGLQPNRSSITASPQYQVPYYNSAGSSQTVVGAVNLTNTGSTVTLTSVHIFSITNVSTMTLSGAYFDVRGSTFVADVITTTSGILGITSASNANSGIVGEYLSSTTVAASLFPGTGNFGDLVSMTLTAGDWDVSGILSSQANGATVTTMSVGISSTTGNSSAGLNEGDSLVKALGPTAATDTNAVVPSYRVNVSASTIYYLKISGGFSIATPKAVGRLSARRIR